jgi:hypothetical protein
VSDPRRRTILPARRAGDPRASAVALVIQLLLIVILGRMVVFPAAMDLVGGLREAFRTERLTYVTVAPAAAPRPSVRQRDGGDGRPPVATRPEAPAAAPERAPTSVPTGVPSVPPGARAPTGGVGPLVGGGGPTLGIRPSYNDPRLWVTPSPYEEPRQFPMTRADSLQAVLHAYGEAFVDSVSRAAPTGRQPGDWTWERNGRKYGMDPQYIRLGKYSIPTALLALLPLNVPANGLEMERARRLSSMRNEIMEQAERRARDDEFYAAVRALRERKERERREAEAARRATTTPTGPSRPPLE